MAALAAASAASCSSPQPVACGGCGCSDASNPPQTFEVSFEMCSDASAADAGATDASASDAGATCFDTCDLACSANRSGATCTTTAPGDGGGLVASCQIQEACLGRKLDGLRAPHIDAPTELAVMLARAAWLEAASVRAFERLASELTAHGAPSSLVRDAKRCARDEARHARIMSKLARAHGARVPRVSVEVCGGRELEAIAVENAIEGCVGETFGALVAVWQSTHAAHPAIAEAMQSIAPDELRHAALAMAVAAWLDTRLTEEARTRVNAAKNGAIRDLLASTHAKASNDFGTPQPHEARAMLATLFAA